MHLREMARYWSQIVVKIYLHRAALHLNKIVFILWTCGEVAKVDSICAVPCRCMDTCTVVILVTSVTCIHVQMSKYLQNAILVIIPGN